MFENLKKKIKSILNPEVRIIKQAGNGMSARVNDFGFVDSGYSYGTGSKWPAGTSDGTPIDIFSHFALRQKARNLMHDSIEARALVQSIVDTTVDVGLKLKPTPIPEVLKKSPEELELWSEKTALMFDMWAQSKKSHRPEINNFYQNQRAYQLFQQRDNDIFVRFYYGRAKDLLNPLQIKFVDPNQIYGFDYTSSYFQDIRDSDGIIRDDSEKETHYKVWYLDRDGKFKCEKIPAIGEKSGRIFMIHGFNPEYASQGRGYSKISHAIQELEDLTNFKHSVIQKAINQASFVAAIENEEQDASNPLEGQVAGPIKEYGSSPQPAGDASNITDASLEPIINWEVTNEATIRQPGSLLVGNLRRGDKMKYLSDTSPGAQYDKFVGSFFSSICASVGSSMEVVLKQFNQNYSASRGTLILCFRTAQIEREEMISDFCNHVYEMWLSGEIALGRIQCPGWSDKFMRAAWLKCEWSGAPMPNIDPLKTAEADQKYTELGAQTLDDVARNFNGSSGKANRTKLIRQYGELPTPPWPRAPLQKMPDEEEEK
jgi:lambda family phage portal protein